MIKEIDLILNSHHIKKAAQRNIKILSYVQYKVFKCIKS